ncbi:hypothetical protein Tco_0685104 [Tanacetum coccineum]
MLNQRLSNCSCSTPTSTITTTAVTTTTTLPPPPLQPQQSTIDPILLQHIGELEQNMANLIQDNSALEEKLNKHGSCLYNLENLNIPQRVSKAVDEIVTNVVDWALQAPLRVRFRELPKADIKEILLQRMWETRSYKTYEDHKNLYEALEKSMDRDHSDQLQADLAEAHKKRLMMLQELLELQGLYKCLHLLLLHLLIPTDAISNMAVGLQSAGFTATQETSPIDNLMNNDSESSPTDYLMKEDSIPEEQVQLSDDEDTQNDYLPNADMRKGWWKPLLEEERPATPEPVWTIPSSNISDVENNWASALVLTYEPPAENSLLAKIGDMTTLMNWYFSKFHMEECHKMLTNQVDWTNPEGDQVRIDVNRPLPLGGPLGHGTIQTQFFFNKDLEYLRYGNKGSRLALLISKMKAAHYPDFRLELLVPEQMWIDEKFNIEGHDSLSCRREVRNHMRIPSVVSIKAYSRYGYDYLSEIVLHQADFQEYKIAKKDFKNLYPSDFEDLNLLLLQGHLDHLPGSDKRWDAKGFEFKHDYTIIKSPRSVVFLVNNNERKIMRFNEIYKFSDGTLIRILEALDYRVKEFKIKRLNPGKLGDSDVHTLEDLTLILEILSRRFFLRLSLPDHRSVQVKIEMEIPHSTGVYFITACSYSTDTSNGLMKAQVYVSKLPMSMPVQMSQAQDGERPQVDDQRLDLADDLKEAQDHISSTITSHKTKITTSKYMILREESKTTR